MFQGLQLFTIQRVVLGHGRQRRLLIIQGGLGIIDAFDIGAKETGKLNRAARGAEFAITDFHRHGAELQPGFGHLSGNRAFPDQRIQAPFASAEPQFLGGLHVRSRRSDGLVSLLRTLIAIGELPHAGVQVGVPEPLLDAGACRIDGFFRQVDAVGSHIGDVPGLVQPLGDLHRLAGRHAQFAVAFLLQCAGRKRRIGLTDFRPLFDAGHLPGAVGQFGLQGAGGVGVQQHHVGIGFQFAGVFIEVPPAGHAFACRCDQLSGETGVILSPQFGLQIPVIGTAKGQPFVLPQHENFDGHRLHAARRQSPRDFFPQQRAQRVAVQAIQDAPRLLCRNQVLVHGPRVLDRVEDRVLGDLGEHHAADRHLGFEQLCQVPANALTLAVFVGRQDQLVRRLQGRLQFLDQFLLVTRNHVQRFEFRIDVDPQIRPRLFFQRSGNLGRLGRQVANVTHAGHHFVAAA